MSYAKNETQLASEKREKMLANQLGSALVITSESDIGTIVCAFKAYYMVYCSKPWAQKFGGSIRLCKTHTERGEAARETDKGVRLHEQE